MCGSKLFRRDRQGMRGFCDYSVKNNHNNLHELSHNEHKPFYGNQFSVKYSGLSLLPGMSNVISNEKSVFDQTFLGNVMQNATIKYCNIHNTATRLWTTLHGIQMIKQNKIN